MSRKQVPRWLGTPWGRFGLLVGVLVLAWMAVSALWSGIGRPLLIEHGVPEAWRQLYGEPPPLVEDRPVPIRKANINGVPIAIPSNYLALVGIEYKDQSTWAPSGPDTPKPDERTFEDDAQAFSLYVRWPDMAPRTPETRSSHRTKEDPDGDVWLLIGVTAFNGFSDEGEYTHDRRLEHGDWAPVLRGRIERLEEGWWTTDEWDEEKGRYRRLKGIRYEMRGGGSRE